MIKKLGKQINIIFFGFFVIFIIFSSIAFNYVFQKTETTNQNIRYAVLKEDLDSFLNGEDVQDFYYCTFHRKDKDSPFKLINNFIPNLSDEKAKSLIKIFCASPNDETLQEYRKEYTQIRRENTIIFVSKRDINETFRNVVIGTIVIDIVLIVCFFFITKFLSEKIIKPVRENEKKEKRFVSNTSHELKTPLTIIKANTEMLEKEIGYNKRIEYISNETARMTKLINNMMELNKASSLSNKEKINISDAVLSVSLPFECVAYDNGKKYELNINKDIYINGNYDQIQSLVSILVDNAISYSKDGGTIWVDLFSKGNKCFLSVTNQGEPIPKENQKLIFDRFYREDESRNEKGNHFGLGLSIAANIADSHNAKISLTSEKDETKFTVVFKKI